MASLGEMLAVLPSASVIAAVGSAPARRCTHLALEGYGSVRHAC
jgi:hypothetical protein